MMKKTTIKDRAMLAAKSQPTVNAETPVAAMQHAPKTGPGTVMAWMERESGVIQENAHLKESLAEWEGVTKNYQLDPKLVRPSRWANRSLESFKGPEFDLFRAEIESEGGNVQPIKVRPVPGGPEKGKPQEFEIIFGHRRHRACLELGIPVFALVEPATELELFETMDRENRGREDLRPWEQGEMYRKALDEGLYPSMRKMCEALGVGQGTVSKSVSLARLPADILNAFASPLDLQFRWATDLTQALHRDPTLMLARAKEAQMQVPRIAANKVFKRLVDQGGDSPGITSPNTTVSIKGKAGQGAEINVNAKAKSMIVSFRNMEPARLAEVKKAIQTLIS
jgi:ParB family chromosome partitioning protein